MDSFFGKGMKCSDRESADFLTVNNCGYYRNISVEMRMRRTEGRRDFQYIYIERGEGNFVTEDGENTVCAGSVVIYRPREKQIYSFRADSAADYYWIHFSGTGAAEILERLGLYGGIYVSGEMFRVRETVKRMVGICRAGGRSAELYAAGLLTEALAETEEHIHSGGRVMKKVIEAMQKDGAAGRKNAEYAELCGLSEYHFIRRFKAETGKTPLKYRTGLIIERAEDLLMKTEMNVAETAALLGFDDALYFSRIFRKETGMSPTEFRAKNALRRE